MVVATMLPGKGVLFGVLSGLLLCAGFEETLLQEQAQASSESREALETRPHSVSERFLARAVFDTRLSQELRFRSGSVRLQVSAGESHVLKSLSGSLPDNVPLAELMECAYIEYSWCEPYMWQAVAYRADDTILRSVRCDGIWISTSDATIWDARFWFGTAPEGREVELDIVLWPYTVAARFHLFPFTRGRSPYAVELSTYLGVIMSETGSTLPDDPCSISLDLYIESIHFQTITLDTSRGNAPISRKYGEPPELSIHYSTPKMVVDELWQPMTCRVFIHEEDEAHLLWSTEIIPEMSHFNQYQDPEMFQVDVEPGMQVIGGDSGWQRRQQRRLQKESWNGFPRRIWESLWRPASVISAVLVVLLLFLVYRKVYANK